MPRIGQFVMSVYREESPTLGEYQKALCAASAEFLPVVLDQDGYRGGRTYRYASLRSIRRATQSALAKHGLWLNHVYGNSERGEFVVTILRHVSGEFVTSTLLIPHREDMQEQKAIQTLLCRTATEGLLAICTEEEDDGASLAGADREKREQWESNLAMALKAIGDAKSESELDRYASMVVQRVKDGLMAPDALSVVTAKCQERGIEIAKQKEKTSANSAGTAGNQGATAARGGSGAADRGVGKSSGTGRADVRSGEQRAPVTA